MYENADVTVGLLAQTSVTLRAFLRGLPSPPDAPRDIFCFCLKKQLRYTRIVTVPDSPVANLCGYLTLAASLPEACWKEATRLYETSIAYARRLHDQ